jgi:hypothetical protein
LALRRFGGLAVLLAVLAGGSNLAMTAFRSTVAKTRAEIEKEARKAARKSRATSTPAKPDRRQRAQHFLREQLARGAKPASDVEEAAVKAHVDPQALGQARGDLGIVTSRVNTGGPQAVQWSLPG